MSVHWMSSSNSRSYNGGGLLPTPRAPLGVNAGNPREHLGINTTFPPHSVRGAPGGKGGLLSTPRNASGGLMPPLAGSLLGNDFLRHTVPHGRAGRGLLPTPGAAPGLIPTPPDNENLNPLARGLSRGMPMHYTDNGMSNSASMPMHYTDNGMSNSASMPMHYTDNGMSNSASMPMHYMDNGMPNSASRGGRPLLPSPPTPPTPSESFNFSHKESSGGLLPTPGSGFLGSESFHPESFHPAGRGISVGLLPTPGGRGRGGLLPTPPGPGIGGGVGPGGGPPGISIGPPPGLGRVQPGFDRVQPGFDRGQPGLGRGLLGLGRGPPGLAMGRGMSGMGIRPGLGRGTPGMGRGHPDLGRGLPGMSEAAATGLLNLVQVLNMGRGNHRGGWLGNRPPLKMKRLSLGMQPQFDYKKNTELKRDYVKTNSNSMQTQNNDTSKENKTEEESMNESNEIETEWCAKETEDNCMIMQDTEPYEEENSSGEGGEFGLDGLDFGCVYEALETGTEEQNTQESVECDEVSDSMPRTMRENNECIESQVNHEAGTRRSSRRK